MAIYPVLFASCLTFLVPGSPAVGILMAVAMVWACGILNLLGVRPVGNASILLTVLLLLPFVGLVGAGLAPLRHWHFPAATAPGGVRTFGAPGAAPAAGFLDFLRGEEPHLVRPP